MEFKIRVEESDPAADPRELGEFLILFQATVEAIGITFTETELSSLSSVAALDASAGKRAASRIRNLNPFQVNECFSERRDRLVQVRRVTQQSPLEIFLVCSALGILTRNAWQGLMAVAVILCSGKIKRGRMGGFEATIEKPLGEGLKSAAEGMTTIGYIAKELRRLYQRGRGSRVGYGFHTVTLKLTPEEFNELRRSVAKSKGSGGWQSFVGKMPKQWNETTLEVTLSQSQLERVSEWQKYPNKGGWQRSFWKIFGRFFRD